MEEKSYWEERLLNMLAEFEGKTLEEKANILRSLCHSHYCSGYSDGNIDGSCGNYYTPDVEYY
jgi:hypothetical protein